MIRGDANFSLPPNGPASRGRKVCTDADGLGTAADRFGPGSIRRPKTSRSSSGPITSSCQETRSPTLTGKSAAPTGQRATRRISDGSWCAIGGHASFANYGPITDHDGPNQCVLMVKHGHQREVIHAPRAFTPDLGVNGSQVQISPARRRLNHRWSSAHPRSDTLTSVEPGRKWLLIVEDRAEIRRLRRSEAVSIS